MIGLKVENLNIQEKLFEDIVGATFLASADDDNAAKSCVLILHEQFSGDEHLVGLFHSCAEMSQNTPGDHLLATISHGSTGDSHYLIHECSRLTPVCSMLQGNPVPPVREAITFTEGLLREVHKIHNDIGGHGFISPASIFMDTALENIKLSGFRAASFAKEALKKVQGYKPESLAYLSPAIVLKPELGPLADLYSVGVLFYRLLVGSLPWPDIQPTDFKAGGIPGSLIPPSLKRLEIPDALDQIVYDMIESKKNGGLTNLLERLAEAKSTIDAPEPALEQPNGPEHGLGRAVKLQETEDDIMEKRQGKAHQEGQEQVTQLFDELPADDDKLAGKQIVKPESATGRTREDEGLQVKGPSSTMVGDSERDPIEGHNPFAESGGGPADDPGEAVLQDQVSSSADNIGPDEDALLSPFGITNNSGKALSTEQKPSAEDAKNDASEPEYEVHEFPIQSVPELGPEAAVGEIESPTDAGEQDAEGATDLPVTPESQAGTPDDRPHELVVSENWGRPAQTEIAEVTPQAASSAITPEAKAPVPDEQQTDAPASGPAVFPAFENNEFEDRASNLLSQKVNQSAQASNRNAAMVNFDQQAVRESALKKNPYTVDVEGIEGLSDSWSNDPARSGGEYEPVYPEVETEPLLQTENLATTETIDMRTSKISKSTIWWASKILLITMVPVAAIYFLITFIFNTGFEDGVTQKRARTFGKADKFANETSAQPLLPTELKNEQKLVASNSGGPGNLEQQTIVEPATRTRAATDRKPVAVVQKAPRATTPSRNRQINPAPRRSRPTVVKPAPSQQATSPRLIVDVLVRGGQGPQNASVYIDGKFYGRTNAGGILSLDNLKANQAYLIKIEKAGFKLWATEKKFSQSGKRNLVVQLIPDQIVDKQTRNVPKPRLARGGETASRTPSAAAFEVSSSSDPAQSGSATINILLSNIEPLGDAFIYVNGELWDGFDYVAPAEIELPAGSYEIKILKSGYRSTPPSYQFDLIAGDKKTVSFILTSE